MSPRRPPARRGRSLVGQRYTVDIGAVAHGGHCVARHEGRVVFVRHTLPGERVLARDKDDWKLEAPVNLGRIYRIVPKGAKTTNWAAARLTSQQLLYAATDAWVCRELYLRFRELGFIAP